MQTVKINKLDRGCVNDRLYYINFTHFIFNSSNLEFQIKKKNDYPSPRA